MVWVGEHSFGVADCRLPSFLGKDLLFSSTPTIAVVGIGAGSSLFDTLSPDDSRCLRCSRMGILCDRRSWKRFRKRSPQSKEWEAVFEEKDKHL
jgi:hypothetical protein